MLTRATRRHYLTHFEIDELFWRDNRSVVRMLGGDDEADSFVCL